MLVGRLEFQGEQLVGNGVQGVMNHEVEDGL